MTSSLLEKLDHYCSLVKLERARSLPVGTDLPIAPADIALWMGTYAQVLLWPVSMSSVDVLNKAVTIAVEWFDNVLSRVEDERARPVDGYLVFALSDKPDGDVSDAVRQIETSTQVCRKHLVWPDENAEEGWRGLLSVTVLGLPLPEGPATRETWPTLEPDVAALWERVSTLGHQQAAQADLGEFP